MSVEEDATLKKIIVDKNTATGLILIALLFIVFNWWVGPPPVPSKNTPVDSTAQQVSPTKTETADNATNPNGEQGKATPAQVQTNGMFVQTPNEQEKFVTLENESLKVTLSNKGGVISEAVLKEFLTYDAKPLTLLNNKANRFSYTFPIGVYTINTEDYYFTASQPSPNTVVFRLTANDTTRTKYVEQRYTLAEEDYLLDYNFSMVGFDDSSLPNDSNLQLTWKNELIKSEQDMAMERMNTTVFYKEANDDATYLACSGSDEETITSSMDWVSFKQQFFNTTLIPEKKFGKATLAITDPPLPEEEDSLIQTADATLFFSYKRQAEFNFPMQMYIGPNNYRGLRALDKGMEDMVPLGWAIFRWVNKGIILPLFHFLNKFIGNYGIIILVITVLIKTVLFPLTYRSYKSMAKMNLLKPEIEEIKEKYGKDPQRVQQETMKLYGKAGANPLGGCLPQLIQMPILIAMYRFFPASIELRQESFLWADDLSTYDSIMSLPFHIPFYGDHVSLFCLLSALSSLAYMRLNSQMTPTAGNDAMAQQMKMFQYLMPVILLFFFNSFSAGLTFYFFLSNIISFGQQYAIKNYFIDEEALHAQIQEQKKKPKKKSKFQERMEEMLKAQQEQQKQIQQGRNKKNRRK